MEVLQMIEKQIKVIVKEAYYMTQYASYMDDDGFYRSFIECLPDGINPDLLIEFLTLTRSMTDKVNDKIYNFVLFRLDNEKLETLINLYQAIIDEDINELESLLNVDRYELYPDDTIGYASDFEEMADNDLKCNGLSAHAIYWAKDIPESDNLLKLDIYDDFEELDVGEIIDTIIDEKLDDFLKDLSE
jgi:hypothetical protein